MLEKKAQVSPVAAFLAIIGAIAAFWMASRMNAGLVMRIVTGLATAAVCYFIVLKMSGD